MPATYVPGVSNLDANETSKRRQGGWIGLALTVIAGAALFHFRVAAHWRLFLCLPATMAAIGFLQAGSRFCVMVALTSRSPAQRAADRAKDRQKAFRLIVTALLIGALVASVAYYL